MERWGGGGFSPLPLPSCQKQEKWKHIKKNPDRLCTMHYYTSLYSAGCKEKIAVDKAVFWGTVSQMNLQKSRFFCRKYPLLSLPFLSHLQLLGRNFDTMNILRIFKPPFVQWLFSTYKSIEEIEFEDQKLQSQTFHISEKNIEKCKFIWYLLLTNCHFLIFILIFLVPKYQIKE